MMTNTSIATLICLKFRLAGNYVLLYGRVIIVLLYMFSLLSVRVINIFIVIVRVTNDVYVCIVINICIVIELIFAL